jgi:hypothetical protein
MKVICEVSRAHYHPGKDFKIEVTKKRDLSIPPNWVANERIEKDGVSYAIVMPARETELFETNQAVHIHIPQYLTVRVNGKRIRAKVKLEPYEFEPRVHFDEDTAEELGVGNGQEGEV